MRQIYLDLDGVMADFDRHFLELFGMESKDLDDPTLWKKINGYGKFFLELPLCPGAMDFFETIRARNPIVLTACPKTNYQVAAIQKREWVREHLGTDIQVLPVLGGKNKVLFMHKKGDILIDDFEKNCIPWREHGGEAIVHRNFEYTRKQLTAIDELGGLGNA